MSHPSRKRLHRSMMFSSAQKPSLIEDPYLYSTDFPMLDPEDAVAVTVKDTVRFLLYQALKNTGCRGCERVVRISDLDTEYQKEDVRCCIAGGADVLRTPKTEDAKMIKTVEDAALAAEREFECPEDSTPLMAMLKPAKDVMSAYEVCTSSERMIGIAFPGGDCTKDLQIKIVGIGVELMGTHQQMIIAARAAGVRCSDTVWTDLDNPEGFQKEVILIEDIGLNGESIINPRQILIVHEVFVSNMKEIIFSEKVIREIDSKRKEGIGIFTVGGKMTDIASYNGAQHVTALVRAFGVYKGEL